MKNTWKLIEDTVQESYLNESEKKNVLASLNKVLGESMILYKFPPKDSNLTENESLVYVDIITSLNENRKFPEVSSIKGYCYVLKELAQFDTGSVTEYINAMDEAFANGNWEEVNQYIKIIEELI